MSVNGPWFVDWEWVEEDGSIRGSGTGPHGDLDSTVRYIAQTAVNIIYQGTGPKLKAIVLRTNDS